MSNMITVADLIEILQQVKDKSRVVILAKDSAGNYFSPVEEDTTEGAYKPIHGDCLGKIGLEELTDKDIAEGYSEEDVLEGDDVIKAFVLWPTN